MRRLWTTILLLAAAPAFAQGPGLGPDEGYPVRISAEAVPPRVAPGGKVTIRVTVSIDPEYHIYGIPPVPEGTLATEIELEGPAGFVPAGPARGPEPIRHTEPWGDVVPRYQGEVVLERDLAVPVDAAAGPVSVTVKLAHMACTEQACLDPTEIEAEIALTVDPDADSGAGGEAAAPPAEGGGAGGGEDESLLGLVIAAFLGGLGSILLPCIYPLIPLTLAFFSKQEGKRASAIGRAVLFCVGIFVTFTVLGVLVGGSLQAVAASLWLNVFLFFLMVALALSLLGMFDIKLPSSWTERMQALGGGTSAFAPVFMGVAFSLASFTCTVGVIGPLLASSASEVGRAAVGMFAYSVGFALPFFVLALFPVLVSAMPRSGGWLNTVKVLLGLFEVCFAGYYLWRADLTLGIGIGSWEIVLALWTVTTFVAGLYLLGKIRLPHDSPLETVSVPRAVGAIVYFAAALYLFGGLMNQITLPPWLAGLLPPRQIAYVAGPDGTATAGKAVSLAPKPDFADDTFHPGFGGVWWTTDYDRALEIGRRTGRRVFLNFTGVSCTNCRTMELGIFGREPVRKEFRELVLAELWTDVDLVSKSAAEKFAPHTTKEQSRRYRELRSAPKPEGYGTTANPQYVILSPEGRILAESGYEADEATFVEFLRTGK